MDARVVRGSRSVAETAMSVHKRVFLASVDTDSGTGRSMRAGDPTVRGVRE